MAVTLNASSSGTGGLSVTSDATGNLAFQTAGTTAITVDSSQNVGIGTSSIADTSSTGTVLEIYGGANAAHVHFTNSATGQTAGDGFIVGTGVGTIDALLIQRESANMIFRTADTERMRIDGSGNLLVGQTSQTGNEKFGVTQSGASSFAAYFNATAGDYGYDVVKIRCARGSATNEYNFINCLQVSTLVFQVQANGNVQNTNNSYGAISDIKLKENIVDATPKLADLMQVKVRNYNLKSDPTHKQIGVIAQELEQVFPAMVEEATDKDEEGNSLGTTTKGVKYSVFVPMLIKSIQELKAINDTQAETINALTARIVALEGR